MKRFLLEDLAEYFEYYFQLTPGALRGPARDRNVAPVRHLFCKAAYLTPGFGYSTLEIGDFLRRNHSTVLNSLDRANSLLAQGRYSRVYDTIQDIYRKAA